MPYHPLKDTGEMRPSRYIRSNFNSICAIVVIIAVLFFTISYFKSNRHPVEIEHFDSEHPMEIPQKYIDEQQNIEITEAYITIDYEKKLKVKTLFAFPKDKNEELFTVLFLHGAAFSSETWRKLGSLKFVASLGLQAMAIDMPGHGDTPKTSETPNFLSDVVKALKLKRPVVVSPSKSGIYSMPYLMKPEPETAHDRLRGFVPIAPTATDSYSHEDLKRVDVPTMIVKGDKDNNIGAVATANLREITNSEVFPIMDAGHACYVEKPDIFHRLFFNFLIKLEPTILHN